jgi:hypothetical protein
MMAVLEIDSIHDKWCCRHIGQYPMAIRLFVKENGFRDRVFLVSYVFGIVFLDELVNART